MPCNSALSCSAPTSPLQPHAKSPGSLRHRCLFGSTEPLVRPGLFCCRAACTNPDFFSSAVTGTGRFRRFPSAAKAPTPRRQRPQGRPQGRVFTVGTGIPNSSAVSVGVHPPKYSKSITSRCRGLSYNVNSRTPMCFGRKVSAADSCRAPLAPNDSLSC